MNPPCAFIVSIVSVTFPCASDVCESIGVAHIVSDPMQSFTVAFGTGIIVPSSATV